MKKFKLLQPHFGNPPGTIVYQQAGHDYGLANDDTRSTGVKHISVTLNSDGSYPGFTVPVTHLEELTGDEAPDPVTTEASECPAPQATDEGTLLAMLNGYAGEEKELHTKLLKAAVDHYIDPKANAVRASEEAIQDLASQLKLYAVLSANSDMPSDLPRPAQYELHQRILDILGILDKEVPEDRDRDILSAHLSARGSANGHLMLRLISRRTQAQNRTVVLLNRVATDPRAALDSAMIMDLAVVAIFEQECARVLHTMAKAPRVPRDALLHNLRHRMKPFSPHTSTRWLSRAASALVLSS